MTARERKMLVKNANDELDPSTNNDAYNSRWFLSPEACPPYPIAYFH